MNEEELYFFDLCGWIRVPGVLSAAEVAAANASVDAHAAEAVQSGHRKGRPRIPDGASLDDTSRWDYRGMLGWEPESSRAPFVNMLAHPKLTRYLNEICGRGFRMDHGPTLITQHKGSPSGTLHGQSGPGFFPASYYIWKDGQMHNGLVVVSFQLVDCPDGSGGLAVVPGSHKGNVRMPSHMRDPGAPTPLSKQLIQQAACDAGDVIICAFTASGDRIKAINRANNPLARRL
jgi:hypothetical protein